ncbi:MAG: hypothetical protein JSS07_06615 [Proteobacteria bacterium]|nr:hypothetical protein [Pseudomonadota bacterium]
MLVTKEDNVVKESHKKTTANTSLTSYLEFGSIDIQNSKKQIYDFKTQQKAYDWFMLGRYANDLLAYQNMIKMIDQVPLTDIFNYYQHQVHHGRDLSQNLEKLIGICSLAEHHQTLKFYEIGQTIFGCIPAIEFCQRLLQALNITFAQVDTKEILWLGKDISEYFNQLAVLLHQGYQVRTSQYDPSFNVSDALSYAKGITLLYAFDSVEKLFSFISNCSLAIFDYSFNLNSEEVTSVGTGIPTHYLNYNAFAKLLHNADVQVYVKKNKSFFNRLTNRLYVEAICAKQDLCQRFIHNDIQIRKKIVQLSNTNPYLKILSDLNEGEDYEWVNILELVFG